MNKKEYCLNNPATAYYSGLGGLMIHGIEYDINDYLFCVSGAWIGKKQYHKVKINYNSTGGAFVKIHGYIIPLNECIRM